MGGGAGNGLNFGATYGSGQLPLEYAAKSTSTPEPANDTSPTVKSAREALLAEAQTEKVKPSSRSFTIQMVELVTEAPQMPYATSLQQAKRLVAKRTSERDVKG